MKLKISWKYVWYEDQVVKMCFINGYPYTFEDLTTEECVDKKVAQEANQNKDNKITYTQEQLYVFSRYLVMEQAHPEHFDMQDEIENPRELPLD
tara:strand:- start:873 stop:1154 length:282 start_codon:yes stop_codon:yes gene_type:complete